jgi:hypothetical protein
VPYPPSPSAPPHLPRPTQDGPGEPNDGDDADDEDDENEEQGEDEQPLAKDVMRLTDRMGAVEARIESIETRSWLQEVVQGLHRALRR